MVLSNYNDRLYHSLPEASSIRLLQIYPGNIEDEEISCELRTIERLETAPPFQALSYVWGDSADTEEIIVNGIEVQVTRNLAHALRRLRPLPTTGGNCGPSEQTARDSHKGKLAAHRNTWSAFAYRREDEKIA